MSAPLNTTCRTCGRPLPEGIKTPTFPFCSKRCKMIDLGRWFTGEHRISEPLILENKDNPPESRNDPE
ncbi:MAG: DNA gyrase inhibitor YacG [Candidatus Omnitrophica bacterium]|nr:DNA gyrase inhibitor YacG [Candidatus Omnitrophota bacterium]